MIPLPSWIDQSAWDAYVSMRIEIRKPLTQRGAVRILKRLTLIHEAGQDANEALDQSSDMRWQDIYPVKSLEVQKPSSDYEQTRERMRAEAARKASPPPPAILRMVRR